MGDTGELWLLWLAVDERTVDGDRDCPSGVRYFLTITTFAACLRVAAMAIILATPSRCFDDEKRLYSSEMRVLPFSFHNEPSTCLSTPSELHWNYSTHPPASSRRSVPQRERSTTKSPET